MLFMFDLLHRWLFCDIIKNGYITKINTERPIYQKKNRILPHRKSNSPDLSEFLLSEGCRLFDQHLCTKVGSFLPNEVELRTCWQSWHWWMRRDHLPELTSEIPPMCAIWGILFIPLCTMWGILFKPSIGVNRVAPMLLRLANQLLANIYLVFIPCWPRWYLALQIAPICFLRFLFQIFFLITLHIILYQAKRPHIGFNAAPLTPLAPFNKAFCVSGSFLPNETWGVRNRPPFCTMMKNQN